VILSTLGFSAGARKSRIYRILVHHLAVSARPRRWNVANNFFGRLSGKLTLGSLRTILVRKLVWLH